jgi:hypothetical protein
MTDIPAFKKYFIVFKTEIHFDGVFEVFAMIEKEHVGRQNPIRFPWFWKSYNTPKV